MFHTYYFRIICVIRNELFNVIEIITLLTSKSEDTLLHSIFVSKKMYDLFRNC